jgi:hypothetical protein
MDTYQWVQGAEQDLSHYLAISATSLPYNVAHVVGNIGFCLLLGPTFVRSLARYRRRFQVQWVAALLVLAFGLAAPHGAQASTSDAVSYLRAAQNSDGGFGGSKGASSTSLHSGWTALGFAAARINPADVQSGGTSVVDYMRAHSGGLTDIGEIERTVLALDASGVNARSFAGRDLVAAIERRRSKNGSWKSNNGWTAFGVLALKATGAPGVKRSARWLAKQHNRDGGFGFRPGATSDVDDTGGVLQALAVGGLRKSKVARRAVAFLRAAQNGDGGFGQLRGGSSNAQSTSWAVQGLVAVGRKPAGLKRHGHTPLSYLRSLQQKGGSIRYSRASAQTPVWVTAQAIDALEQKAFPLRAAPRVARARRATPSAPRPGAGRPPRARKKQRARHRKAAPRHETKQPAGTPSPPAPAATPSPEPVAPHGPAPARPGAPPSQPSALAIFHTGNGNEGAAWAGGALVAGVAGFALWRLTRRRSGLGP